MRMQTAPTPMDRMYAIVILDILEMDKIAQVNSVKRGKVRQSIIWKMA